MSEDPRVIKMRQMREDAIARHGWMVQSVFPTSEVPGHHFSYTIGLHDKGAPELLAIGLPGDVAQQLLNDVAKLMLDHAAQAKPLPVGLVQHPRWPMPFYILPTPAEAVSDWATGALNRSHGQAQFRQICWPDKAGRFPWDSACEQAFNEAQPVLGEPPVTLH